MLITNNTKKTAFTMLKTDFDQKQHDKKVGNNAAITIVHIVLCQGLKNLSKRSDPAPIRKIEHIAIIIGSIRSPVIEQQCTYKEAQTADY